MSELVGTFEELVRNLAEVHNASCLRRNVLIDDGATLCGTPFVGKWVAIPREDFDKLRSAVKKAQECLNKIRTIKWSP